MLYKLDASGIWKFNTANNAYALYYTNVSLSMMEDAQILSVSNRIVIYSISNSIHRIIFYAFSDNSTALSLMLYFTEQSYHSRPSISISSNLTKAVFYGYSNTISNKQVDSFFI